MSGGSYDYMSQEMASGGTEMFRRYADKLISDLAALRSRLDTLTMYDHKTRMDVPYPRADAARIAILAAQTAVVEATEKLKSVEKLMEDLAPIAHEVEWWQSNDAGPDAAADGCINWMYRKLGLKP